MPGELEEAPGSDDGCLLDVFWGYWDLVVTFEQVDLGEDSTPLQAVGKITYIWQWVSVLNCLCIEVPVVTTRTPASVWLWLHVEGTGPIAVGPTDNTEFLQFEPSCLAPVVFLLVQSADFSMNRATFGLYVVDYTMLDPLRLEVVVL